MSSDCRACQYSDPRGVRCYNYLGATKDVKAECESDGDRDVILMATRGRSWLTVDEIIELKRTAT